MEQELRESEERYRSLVETSTDAIMMLDKNRTIVSCNQAFVDVFGYQRMRWWENRHASSIHLRRVMIPSASDHGKTMRRVGSTKEK